MILTRMVALLKRLGFLLAQHMSAPFTFQEKVDESQDENPEEAAPGVAKL